MKDHTALENAARAATPGPWNVGFSDGSGAGEDRDGFYITTPDKYPEDGAVNEAAVVSAAADSWGIGQGVRRSEDATYIALANPSTVLELLAEIKALRVQTDDEEYCKNCDCFVTGKRPQ